MKGMVDEALEASREGNIVSRVARDLTGGEEDAQVPPRVTYSRAAVGQLVERVVARVNRPAQDAKVEFPSLDRVKEQPGWKVDAAALEQRVEQALSVPGVDRRRATPPWSGSSRRSPARSSRGSTRCCSWPTATTSSCASTRSCGSRTPTPWRSAPSGSTPRPGCTTSRTRRSTPPGTFRRATGPATSPARWFPAACPTIRSRPAGWASSTARASTAPTRPTRSGAPPRTAASGWRCPDVIELYDQVPVGAPIYIA